MWSKPRAIAVLTTGRQDYGILRSTLPLLQRDDRFRLLLWVGGMHLKERFGLTVRDVEADGLAIERRLDFVDEPPEPAGDAARALETVSRALHADHPDAILLVADRAETLAAGFAAALCRVPVIHLHGGEESEGAIDNAFRHALTKLSHLHLVSHEDHARRVLQMGEDPDSVVVVGPPGLDNRYRPDLPNRTALARDLGCSLEAPVVLVTVQPTTLGCDPIDDVAAVAGAMTQVAATYIVSQPNADEGGAAIRGFWSDWARGRTRVRVVDAVGATRLWGLLQVADAVLGNSSSGIIEAPAVGVPAVNVGDRQKGRLRHPSVEDVPAEVDAITAALRRAITPERKVWAASLPPMYPAGPAASRIVEAIAAWRPPIPPRKRFHAVPWPELP